MAELCRLAPAQVWKSVQLGLERNVASSYAPSMNFDAVKRFFRPTTPEQADALAQEHDGGHPLTLQQAADLVGVSRPYMAARIAASDVPLHRQSGDELLVLASDVRKWDKRSREQRRNAMTDLVNNDDALGDDREHGGGLRERFERNLAEARAGKGLPNTQYWLDKTASESGHNDGEEAS